jgi:aminobenzoyl-glutamate utilization protein B
MQENYAFIADAIDTRCQTLTDIADAIWDHPETRFEEFWSAERLASALEAEGFTLTREAGGIPNALSPASAAGNRLSPCWVNTMRWPG